MSTPNDTATADYLATFDDQAHQFQVVQNGTPFFMLVDQNDQVWLNGAPFCTVTEAIYDFGYKMPNTEAEAWEQRP